MHSTELVNQLKASTLTDYQIMICPITGITSSIKVYPTPGLFYDYPHPFSIYANAVAMAELPYQTVTSKYDRALIAGAFLTVFTLGKRNLIADKLSAAQKNLLLQTTPAFILIDAMRFIISLSDKHIEWLPKLSLIDSVEQPTLGQPMVETIRTYIRECTEIVYPGTATEKTATKKQDDADYTVKILASKGITSKVKFGMSAKELMSVNKSTMKENKAQLKECYNWIKKDGLLPDSVISWLKIQTQDNNLELLDQDSRIRFMAKTKEKYSNIPAVMDAAKIINHPIYDKRSIKDKSEQSMITTPITDLSDYKPKIILPKRTIAMIIEAKKRNVAVSVIQYEIAEREASDSEPSLEIEEIEDAEGAEQTMEDEDGLQQAIIDYDADITAQVLEAIELGDNDDDI